MKSKKVRNIKVISQNGCNYKPTPTIILKGQWLNEIGFEIGDQIKAECENGCQPGQGRFSGRLWRQEGQSVKMRRQS
ncbi:MAG: type I toxin-antitoxin system SymE family toxin [Lachnospiraceae bacterium]|nr:type I toxin-antitoxin system SymE family toxin [Lachnospiraceae bacterium]